MIFLTCKRVHPQAVLPVHHRSGAHELCASLTPHETMGPPHEEVLLHVGEEPCLVSVGVAFAIPRGWMGLIQAVPNGRVRALTCVVPATHRDEVCVAVVAWSPGSVVPVRQGEPIALLYLVPTPEVLVQEVQELHPYERK